MGAEGVGAVSCYDDRGLGLVLRPGGPPSGAAVDLLGVTPTASSAVLGAVGGGVLMAIIVTVALAGGVEAGGELRVVGVLVLLVMELVVVGVEVERRRKLGVPVLMRRCIHIDLDNQSIQDEICFVWSWILVLILIGFVEGQDRLRKRGSGRRQRESCIVIVEVEKEAKAESRRINIRKEEKNK